MKITEADTNMVDTMVNRLSEEFDAVAILVSRAGAKEGTYMLSRGSGNYYARLGMCQEFINNGQADTLAEKLNP